MPARTFLGNPCQHGHDGLRYLSNGACVHCTKAKRKAAVAEAREQAADEGRPKRAYRRKVAVTEVKDSPEVVKKGGSGVKKTNGRSRDQQTVDIASNMAHDLLDDL